MEPTVGYPLYVLNLFFDNYFMKYLFFIITNKKLEKSYFFMEKKYELLEFCKLPVLLILFGSFNLFFWFSH
jgi:hypothetical protein